MQTSRNYRPGYPLNRLFVPFPYVCFILVLATDIAFWQTANLMWQNFSAWLLFAGLLFSALSILAGLVDLIRASTRLQRPSLAEIIGFAIILALALVNSFVHAGDGWTAVVPLGLALSAATVFVIFLTLILGVRSQRTLNWRTP